MSLLTACRRLQVFVSDSATGQDLAPSGPGHLLDVELWVRAAPIGNATPRSSRDMLINLRELDPLIERMCLARALPENASSADDRWVQWLQGLSQDLTAALKDLRLELDHLRVGTAGDWGMELWPES